VSINLTKVREVLHEVDEVVDDLDGRWHNDSRPKPSHERAATSRQLQFLATRLELAAALTRSEYWAAKGYTDHIHDED
jgi:hypothetical protein